MVVPTDRSPHLERPLAEIFQRTFGSAYRRRTTAGEDIVKPGIEAAHTRKAGQPPRSWTSAGVLARERDNAAHTSRRNIKSKS